jgi:dolichol kinase
VKPGWLRPLLHLISGLVLLTLFVSRHLLGVVLLVGLVVAAVVEGLRISQPRVQAFLARVLPVFRPEEARRPSGAAWLSAAYALATWLPPRAAVAAVLVGAIADPAAAIVGSRWGGGRRKSWPGSFAALSTSIVALLVLGVPPAAAAVAGAAAAGLERWPGPFDDNLLVGPGAGVVVWWLA